MVGSETQGGRANGRVFVLKIVAIRLTTRFDFSMLCSGGY